MTAKKSSRKIAVLDFETDPFLFGRLPKPFSWGLYTDDMYRYWWQGDAWTDANKDKCVKKLLDLLESIDEPLLIYAHNGGKFDFLFFIKHLEGKIKIVNGRILEAKIGIHTLRDSYAILPIPLASAGGKKEIDYKFLERDVRESHKDEILDYLYHDCLSLHQLITAFWAEFGDILTVGSAAMKELKKFHSYEAASESFDKFFRQYYFGGRCQCFETGVINMPVKGFDANSAYPNAMKRAKHPISLEHEIVSKVSNKTSFVCWEGLNHNAVPTRELTGSKGLRFDIPSGTFYTTIHEFNAGLETGTIEPHKIKHAVDFAQTSSFESFVDHFYTSRLAASAAGDVFNVIFYKLILNSAYGKFAQSPDNFQDSLILPYGEFPPPKPDEDLDDLEWYRPEYIHGEYQIWSKPSPRKTYYNVATAASITGAARANLLTAISKSTRPVYCDTDSVYCEDMTGNLHSKELGAWKLEFTGDQIAIAGKKLYAVMKDDVCIKKASKGVRLNPLAIFMAARGDVVETRNDAPTFKLNGGHEFIERRVRRTQ